MRGWTESEKFAAWLRSARGDSMTQEELAKAASISRARVSQLENAAENSLTGKATAPSRDIVIQLARALGASESEALLAAGYAPSSPHWADAEEPGQFDLSDDPIIEALSSGLDPEAIKAAREATLEGARMSLAEYIKRRNAEGVIGKRAE